ncbi:MAG: NAD(P)/FAD-dependent oxidoreductase [Pseudonocardiaceae bacterium]|nr:NAD(P)/FAD-dependent oxidoreductase [Pseudonocardiaceae bacterium]
MSQVLVVGNGFAAHRLVDRLHRYGHQDSVTVLGAEQRPAYNRMLLPSVLTGALDSEALTLPAHPAGTRVRVGVRARCIDRDRRLVYATSSGRCGTVDEIYRYDELVLATGARPRVPTLPGVLTDEGELAAGVATLRTLADCERISPGQVVVLGAGVLGVETALELAGSGCAAVTLVHPGSYPMNERLDRAAGRLLADHLAATGVALHLGREAVEYRRGQLLLDNGRLLTSDTVLLCTGVTPEVTLARDAGLPVGSGVVVDDRLRTDDPHIYAIGDCAEYNGVVGGHVAPAWQQAETLARLLTGGDARYRGTAHIMRLRASVLDAACFGPLHEVTEPDSDVEMVALWDRERVRYAKLALRDQRLAGAVLFGFHQAIASISQLYDRNLPMPSGRLELLLGEAAGSPAAIELPDEAVICRCNNVTKKTLIRVWHAGARDVPALAEETRATRGCGSCTREVRRIRDALEYSESHQIGLDNRV